MHIGDKIKLLRKEKGWSQDNLAEKIGTYNVQISTYEANKNTPALEIIIKLAQIFNVSTDYLLFDDAPRASAKYTNNIEVIELL